MKVDESLRVSLNHGINSIGALGAELVQPALAEPAAP